MIVDGRYMEIAAAFVKVVEKTVEMSITRIRGEREAVNTPEYPHDVDAQALMVGTMYQLHGVSWWLSFALL